MDLGARGLIDLQSYVDHLEANNLLIRVKSEVDPHLELAGIAKKFEGTKVLLFENVKGYSYPVLIGLYWNRHVMASIFGCSAIELPSILASEFEAWANNPVEPVVVSQGLANEVVEDEVDLNKLPIPHHAIGDGGRYLSCCAVIAKDPDTGVRNLSTHRMMVVGKNRVTALFEETGHMMNYFKRAEAKGEPLEITISNGVDMPVHMGIVATASVETDETGVVSQLRGEPVELLKAQTVDVEAIANAQFVLEARVLPNVREIEGPFMEGTGYYAEADKRMVFEITKITRRKNPIYHALLSGWEMNSFGVLSTSSILAKVRKSVPEVTAVHFVEGCGPYHLIVRMNKTKQGRERDAIMAAFASMVYLNTVTVVDEDVDIYDRLDVDWAVQTRCKYEKDLMLFPDSFGHDMSPVTTDAKWTRMGIDATIPLDEPPEKYVRASFKDVDLSEHEITGV